MIPHLAFWASNISVIQNVSLPTQSSHQLHSDKWLLFQIRELASDFLQAALFWLVYVNETRLNRPSYFQY